MEAEQLRQYGLLPANHDHRRHNHRRLVSDGGDTTSIYWVGTFETPATATEPYTLTSKRDAAATDSALLASTDDIKELTYEGDTLSYEVSILGAATKVELKKD